MKKLRIIGLIVLLVAVLSGCGISKEESVVNQVNSSEIEQQEKVESFITSYPLTIIDGMNREVVIESEPNRIVSIAPSVTETLFAIGAGDKVVGRTDYCVFPAETANIATIGSLKQPNIEAIAELNPDMVIASTHFKEEVLKQLEAINIPVIVLTAQESFDGVYEVTGKAGLITNHQLGAKEVIESMKVKVVMVQKAVENQTPKSVYYVIGYGKNDFTATGETFINDMLMMAGGDNIAKDGKGWSYNLEKLLEHNPEIILISNKYDSLIGFISSTNYQVLNAVKENRVIEIDSDLISIQGPRLADGLLAIAERLHPEQFK